MYGNLMPQIERIKMLSQKDIGRIQPLKPTRKQTGCNWECAHTGSRQHSGTRKQRKVIAIISSNNFYVLEKT